MGRGNGGGGEKNERRTCWKKRRKKKCELGLEIHRYTYIHICTHVHTHTHSQVKCRVSAVKSNSTHKSHSLLAAGAGADEGQEKWGCGSGYCEFYGAWHLNGQTAEEIADSVRKTLLMLHWLCLHPLSPFSCSSPPLAKFYRRPCCARICAACSSFGLYGANVGQRKAEHNGSLHVYVWERERNRERECLSALHTHKHRRTRARKLNEILSNKSFYVTCKITQCNPQALHAAHSSLTLHSTAHAALTLHSTSLSLPLPTALPTSRSPRSSSSRNNKFISILI